MGKKSNLVGKDNFNDACFHGTTDKLPGVCNAE